MSGKRRKKTATAKNRPSKSAKAEKKIKPRVLIEVLVNGVRVELSPEMEDALQRAYKGMYQPLPSEMTTTQAADFLDVSRPFVIKLIKQRELPCRMIGKHRRIPTAALVEYRGKMFQRARIAADEITQISQELGLYELEGPPPKAP